MGGLSFGPVPPDALLGYNYIDCTLVCSSARRIGIEPLESAQRSDKDREREGHTRPQGCVEAHQRLALTGEVVWVAESQSLSDADNDAECSCEAER